MKGLTRRPHSWVYISESNPVDRIKDVRDHYYKDWAALPLAYHKRPSVYDLSGDLDGHANIEIQYGTTQIDYKLIR